MAGLFILGIFPEDPQQKPLVKDVQRSPAELRPESSLDLGKTEDRTREGTTFFTPASPSLPTLSAPRISSAAVHLYRLRAGCEGFGGGRWPGSCARALGRGAHTLPALHAPLLFHQESATSSQEIPISLKRAVAVQSQKNKKMKREEEEEKEVKEDVELDTKELETEKLEEKADLEEDADTEELEEEEADTEELEEEEKEEMSFLHYTGWKKYKPLKAVDASEDQAAGQEKDC